MGGPGQLQDVHLPAVQMSSNQNTGSGLGTGKVSMQDFHFTL